MNKRRRYFKMKPYMYWLIKQMRNARDKWKNTEKYKNKVIYD